MLIVSFTGKKEVSSLLFHKPVSKIVVREIFNPEKAAVEYPQTNVPYARVRLVDGNNGSSSEVVPKMLLTHLSELATKYEGFDVRAGSVDDTDTGKRVLSGDGVYSIILGAITENGKFACVDLSNQKYFDLELTGLDENATYEIYGIEGYQVSPFVRKYSNMYLSRDEMQKNIVVGDNELLILPVIGLEEVQFYPSNGKSFTLKAFELHYDAMCNNDIASVNLSRGIRFNVDDLTANVKLPKDALLTHVGNTLRAGGGFSPTGAVVDISLGYEDLTVIDLTDIVSFDIRRPANLAHVPYTFYMADTKLSGN